MVFGVRSASTHALETARSYWLAPAMAELTTQPTERLSSATSQQGAEQPRGDDRSPPGSYGSPPDVIIIYGLGGLCLIFVLLLAIYGANYIIQSKQEVRLLESEANDSWILRVPEGASSEDVPIPVVIATSRPARISPRSSLTAFPSLETFLRQDYMTRQNDGGVSRGTGDERVHSTRALETAL
ncbi:hypothetical protein ISCGN_031097 [Ixodes scapularis]